MTDRRISYYTRKVAEYGSVHPSQPLPRSYKYRYDRLKQYKEKLNQLCMATNAGEGDQYV